MCGERVPEREREVERERAQELSGVSPGKDVHPVAQGPTLMT